MDELAKLLVQYRRAVSLEDELRAAWERACDATRSAKRLLDEAESERFSIRNRIVQQIEIEVSPTKGQK